MYWAETMPSPRRIRANTIRPAPQHAHSSACKDPRHHKTPSAVTRTQSVHAIAAIPLVSSNNSVPYTVWYPDNKSSIKILVMHMPTPIAFTIYISYYTFAFPPKRRLCSCVNIGEFRVKRDSFSATLGMSSNADPFPWATSVAFLSSLTLRHNNRGRAIHGTFGRRHNKKAQERLGYGFTFEQIQGIDCYTALRGRQATEFWARGP